MNHTIRELDTNEILAVAGGEPGDTICPPPRRWPFPRPWLQTFDLPSLPSPILTHG
jgi:hypothetical protein